MTITLAPKFRGPDQSGNGGYTCGLLAGAVGGDVITVTLRKPPPLEVALEVRDGSLLHGDEVVAVAAPGELSRAVPEPVPYDVAVAASKDYPGFTWHPFVSCYTCGPDRPDGLRIFPGHLSDDVVAAPWVPTEAVAPEIVWAALDCPGGWSLDLVSQPRVLGRMTATVSALPAVGDECVVVGQAHGIDGRKGFTSSALYGPDGALLARAEATWIAVDPAAINALR